MDVDARWIVLVATAYGMAAGAAFAALFFTVAGLLDGGFYYGVPLVAAVFGSLYGGLIGLSCGVVVGAWSGLRTGLGPEERARTFPAVVVATLATLGALAWWRVDDGRNLALLMIAPAIPLAWFGARWLALRYVRHIASMEARGLLRGPARPTERPTSK